MRPLGIARTKAIRILFGAVLAAYYCLNLAVLTQLWRYAGP